MVQCKTPPAEIVGFFPLSFLDGTNVFCFFFFFNFSFTFKIAANLPHFPDENDWNWTKEKRNGQLLSE